MGTNLDIFVGLIEFVEAFAEIPVAVPNRTYNGERPYYRLSVMPAFNSSYGVTSGTRVNGIVQIDCVVDEDTGIAQVTALVDIIIQQFKRPLIITEGDTKIRFTRAGSPGPPITEGAGYFIPVSVPYVVITGD